MEALVNLLVEKVSYDGKTSLVASVVALTVIGDMGIREADVDLDIVSIRTTEAI